MNLRHAVITSVNRDELADGGSAVFAETVRQVRAAAPGISIEVLIPDFKGDEAALRTVLAAAPEILNHNVETVPRLYRQVRPQADYQQSLRVLQNAKAWGAPLTKSGLMVGLGETEEELDAVFADLAGHGVDILTIGQYLQPTPAHLPISRYVPPSDFARYRQMAQDRGFRHVESGPLVRSSYHAEDQAAMLIQV
jgi:lipoic acid synthetase